VHRIQSQPVSISSFQPAALSNLQFPFSNLQTSQTTRRLGVKCHIGFSSQKSSAPPGNAHMKSITGGRNKITQPRTISNCQNQANTLSRSMASQISNSTLNMTKVARKQNRTHFRTTPILGGAGWSLGLRGCACVEDGADMLSVTFKMSGSASSRTPGVLIIYKISPRILSSSRPRA